MIRRLRNLTSGRRHPKDRMLSRYLERDLDARHRRAVEAHVRECARCQRALASLEETVRALGLLEAKSPPGLTESIIAALRAESPPQTVIGRRRGAEGGLPRLTLVPGSGRMPAADRVAGRWPQDARAALRWCVQKPQLLLTVPIALGAGVILSLVNMGGMLMHGRIDVGVCVSCATDFLVPFLLLNVGLLLLLRMPRRQRL